MINFDDVTKENKRTYSKLARNLWSYICIYIYKILLIGCSGSGKANSLFNLINQKPGINKVYLYAKYPYDEKCKFLTNKRESIGLKTFNDSKAFTEYWNDMDDIYKNIKEYNPNKKSKILTVFDDVVGGMFSNKKT